MTAVAALVALPVAAGAFVSTLDASSRPTTAQIVSSLLGEQYQAVIESGGCGTVVVSGDGAGVDVGVPEADLESGPCPEIDVTALSAALPDDDRLVSVRVARAAVVAGQRATNGQIDVVESAQGPEYASLRRLGAGALPSAADEVALSRAVADRLKVGPGDSVTLHQSGATPVQMRVTGILAADRGVPGAVVGQGSPVLTAPWAGYVEVRWYVAGDRPVEWPVARELAQMGTTVTSRSILTDTPAGLLVPRHGNVSVSSTTVLLVAMALVEVVLLIVPAFTIAATRATRSLAMVAAVGGDRATLRRIVLLVGGTLGTVAAVAGAALGVGLAVVVAVVSKLGGSTWIAGVRVPVTVLGWVLVGVGVAVVAALPPAISASRRDPVLALRGRREHPRSAVRWGVPGLVLVVLGVVLATIGATAGYVVVLVVGAVAVEGGVAISCGTVIAGAARLAPHVGVALRIALRDAARHRRRTGPAAAAVAVAIASVVAGVTAVDSRVAYDVDGYQAFGANETLLVMVESSDALGRQQEAIHQALERTGLVSEVLTASLAISAPAVAQPEDASSAASATVAATSVAVERAPGQECPVRFGPERLTRADVIDAASDSRCGWGHWARLGVVSIVGGALVDDGTLLRLLRLPGSGDSADALAAGSVVVASPHDLQPNGNVRIVVRQSSSTTGEALPSTERVVELPAVVVADGTPGGQFVLPVQALAALGLVEVPGAVVARPVGDLSERQLAEISARLVEVAPDAHVLVERPPGGTMGMIALLALLAAAAVAMASVGLSVTLASADSAPDLATLAAVGAIPRMRRRLAAAQALVVVVTGSVLGSALGVVLGAVLVESLRHGGDIELATMATRLPWLVIAGVVVVIPALVAAGAWLLTRPHVPVVRRIED